MNMWFTSNLFIFKQFTRGYTVISLTFILGSYFGLDMRSNVGIAIFESVTLCVVLEIKEYK